ncbi:MAG: M23 family metallopeptidase [Nevskia sp.]|nr:M23 family metallopeptidase [Nevskia sp.]
MRWLAGAAILAGACPAGQALAALPAPALEESINARDAASLPVPQARPVALDTPVEDAHITSPYGWRVHPILKRRRFHMGVDYGAPQGTPVHAAADGVIVEIGRRGHYGLYLRMRHGGNVQTAYAHLAGFAPQLHAGSIVRRGEVIASVGRTGWATGPHLYYEVIVNGRRVDPCRPGLDLANLNGEREQAQPQPAVLHAAKGDS